MIYKNFLIEIKNSDDIQKLFDFVENHRGNIHVNFTREKQIRFSILTTDEIFLMLKLTLNVISI